MQWTAPKIDGLRAAFFATADGLVPADGQGDLSKFEERAALTRALWTATQQVPDAAMMLVKSEAGASIGLLNGGLVVEGTAKINLGIVRAKTRQLDPQHLVVDETGYHNPDATRVRRHLWQILDRLSGAHLPRVYGFDLAGVTGQIHAAGGILRFGGGFDDPAGFVAALSAACHDDGQVAYTLEDLHDEFGETVFTCGDVLVALEGVDVADTFEFDPDGWPLSCPQTADFAQIRLLSRIAVAACAMSDVNGDLTLTAMSGANKPVLTGKTTADRSMILALSAM